MSEAPDPTSAHIPGTSRSTSTAIPPYILRPLAVVAEERGGGATGGGRIGRARGAADPALDPAVAIFLIEEGFACVLALTRLALE